MYSRAGSEPSLDQMAKKVVIASSATPMHVNDRLPLQDMHVNDRLPLQESTYYIQKAWKIAPCANQIIQTAHGLAMMNSTYLCYKFTFFVTKLITFVADWEKSNHVCCNQQ
jgi:hypothetical protein